MDNDSPALLHFSKYVDNNSKPEPLLSGHIPHYTMKRSPAMRVFKYKQKAATVAQVSLKSSFHENAPKSYAIECAKKIDVIGIIAMAIAAEKLNDDATHSADVSAWDVYDGEHPDAKKS